MGALAAPLLLALASLVSSSYVLLGDYDEPAEDILWPSEYYFRGQKIDVINGLTQPFRMWYSAEYNRSRYELYDGEVNNYYISSFDEESGGTYKVITETTKDLSNSVHCLYSVSYSDQRDFMPDTYTMNRTDLDSRLFNGKPVIEWKRESKSDSIRSEVILLVWRTEKNVDVPVLYEQKTYSLDAGKLMEHTITEYYDFRPSVSVDDVDVEYTKDDCKEIGSAFPDQMKILHPEVPMDVDIAFDGYEIHHKKKYKSNEIALRKSIFHKNWRLVEDHNRKNLGYKMAINKFADRTDDELQFLTGILPSDPNSQGSHTFHSLEEVEKLADQLPDEFDLRLEGFLRPVKYQGECLSCWAFAATATVEGALSYNGVGGRSVELSEQSLVDCAWGYNNIGCMGGTLDGVFRYVLDHGIPTDADYGDYKQIDGTCHVQNQTTFKIRGFGKVNSNSINSVKLALNKYGPVAISVEATQRMLLYSSGIFYDESSNMGPPNHALVIVGYGLRHGDLYWVVRNSWGVGWGEDGYLLMLATENHCLALDSPYYVVV